MPWQNPRILMVVLKMLLIYLGIASETLAAEVSDLLTVPEMFAQADLGPGPVDNRYFIPMGEYSPAKHDFSATLVIPESVISGRANSSLPGAAIKYFRSGDRLLPATRGIVRAGEKWKRWNIIFSPGRVWSEAGDKGFSRASFPFVLSHRTWTEAHNGVATFLFDDTTVSQLVFQIIQETSPLQVFDDWGRIPISLLRGTIEHRDRIEAEYARELNERLPTRPLSELATDFGSWGQEALRRWPEPNNDTASGLLIDGTIYMHGCRTHFGPYPYCDEMRYGVYSMTKSLGALLTILRLAQKYGGGVFDLKIKDYVSVSAAHDGWNEVTFADALNMATGIGDAPVKSANPDEDGIPPYSIFMSLPSASEKLEAGFTSGNYPWGPGEVFRYRSIDTFILAAAMDSFLKSREGPKVNIWDMVIEEVLKPIGVYHVPMMHTIEADGSRGIPILGEGIFPTYHDIAKITLLLQSDGHYRGEQLLNAEKLREALYKSELRGNPFPANNPRFAGFSYHMSLWHVPMEFGECTVSVAKMAGHGGNTALLLPSGTVAFFVQVAGVPVDPQLAAAANAVRPECR